ncbi:telomerase RNA component interacting RNase [Rana temporaria]|uniref:telomerase RNA component interacting RNase n=1 Tax=Rana temporaria TaxID=8407 RepID=UPI001AAC8658|nr:telomerase RNA component interacting RNase [Rana temporaria]
MAEESPRPESGEDSEGEAAAEAPALMKKETPPESEDSTEEEEAKATPEPPPPPHEEGKAQQKASPSPTAPQPLQPTPPALPITMPAYPAYYTPAAAPAFPSTTPGVNVFANDGSFMELFKKKMEQGPAGSKEEAAPEEKKPPEPEKRKPISFVGRRRGGAKLALKTGLVAKKPKTDEEEVVVQKGGAWAQYMAEVKKYKAHQCSDDDKTRPLVK